MSEGPAGRVPHFTPHLSCPHGCIGFIGVTNTHTHRIHNSFMRCTCVCVWMYINQVRRDGAQEVRDEKWNIKRTSTPRDLSCGSRHKKKQTHTHTHSVQPTIIINIIIIIIIYKRRVPVCIYDEKRFSPHRSCVIINHLKKKFVFFVGIRNPTWTRTTTTARRCSHLCAAPPLK